MRDVQKCEKFDEMLRQSVLGSLESCMRSGMLLVYGKQDQQARNQVSQNPIK